MATRSLGTLTLDVIAKTGGFVQGMSKAERESKKWRRQVQKDVSAVGRAFKVASATAVAGLAAMTVQTVNSVRDLKNFAGLANTTTQEFQRMSYGARRFGIDQSKLADILKDTNDRISNFVQTGGGPMADFFEKIAPQVGVTADEFARLSGPAALQLYVDSLNKANLSQADMTFYMEAMASDSALLLPLLRDGGTQMRRLGDEAERTGNVFSSMQMEQLSRVKDGLDDLAGAATGMKNQITMAALPAITNLTETLSDEYTIENAQALGAAIVTSINAVVKAVDGAIDITRFLAEELAAMTVGVAPDDIARLERDAGKIRGILEGGGLLNAGERLRFFGKKGIVKYWSDEELREELANLEKQIEAYYSSSPLLSGRDKPSVAPVEIPGLTAPRGSGAGGSAVGGELDDLTAKADRLKESLLAPLEILQRSESEYTKMLDAGLIGFDQYSEAMGRAVVEYEEAVGQTAETSKDKLDDIYMAVQGFGRNFEDALIEATKGGADAFHDMANAILEDIARIAIRTQITQPLAGAANDWIGGMFANADGNAFAAGNVIPFARGGVVDGPTLFPMANGAGLMGEAGPEAIMPLKRGADGKLGVAAEGGGTVVQIIDQRQGGRAAEVQESRGPDGRQMIRVLIRDEMKSAIGSGALDRTMQSTYGLRRRGA